MAIAFHTPIVNTLRLLHGQGLIFIRRNSGPASRKVTLMQEFFGSLLVLNQ
jgi:hypothetical protein